MTHKQRSWRIIQELPLPLLLKNYPWRITLAIAVINGGKHSSATLKALANELKPAIEDINNLSEYTCIAAFVNHSYKDDKNILKVKSSAEFYR
jgi:hypothetical protein